MICKLFIVDWGGKQVCLASDHEPYCSGLKLQCDKGPDVCPFATWQGPEIFCKHAREMRDCDGDRDFCDLTNSEKP